MLSSVVPSSPSKSCSDALDVNIAEITAHIVLFLYTADFDQDQVHDGYITHGNRVRYKPCAKCKVRTDDDHIIYGGDKKNLGPS